MSIRSRHRPPISMLPLAEEAVPGAGAEVCISNLALFLFTHVQSSWWRQKTTAPLVLELAELTETSCTSWACDSLQLGVLITCIPSCLGQMAGAVDRPAWSAQSVGR